MFMLASAGDAVIAGSLLCTRASGGGSALTATRARVSAAHDPSARGSSRT
jgi:hypothetical protein